MTRVVGGTLGRLSEGRAARKRRRELPNESEEWSRFRLMEERGEVSIGGVGLPEKFWNLPLPKDSGNSVRRAVSEDREEKF